MCADDNMGVDCPQGQSFVYRRVATLDLRAEVALIEVEGPEILRRQASEEHKQSGLRHI